MHHPDALLLEGDKDLKYLREINERYGSKDFLVLTYTPVSSFTGKRRRYWNFTTSKVKVKN